MIGTSSTSALAQMKMLILILVIVIVALVATVLVVFVILPGMNVDTDGDGVVDSVDNCMNTPAGVEVDANGCATAASGVEDCGNGNCAGTETCATCAVDCLSVSQVCCNGVAYTGTCCVNADCVSPQICRPDHTCGAEIKQCEDGLDNDGNGCADYPYDSGCDSASDNDESGGVCYCSDSDDGKNYTVLGRCTDLTPQTVNDECIDSDHLKEYYCAEPTGIGNPECTFEVYACPEGYECMGGRCMQFSGENCSWQLISTLGNSKSISSGIWEMIDVTGLAIGQYKLVWDIRRADETLPEVINFLLIEDPDGIRDENDFDNIKSHTAYFNETTGTGEWRIEIGNFNAYTIYHTTKLYQWICEGWGISTFDVEYSESSATGNCIDIDVSSFSADEANITCMTLGNCDEEDEECMYDGAGGCTCQGPSISECEAYVVNWSSDVHPQEQCMILDCPNDNDCYFSVEAMKCQCQTETQCIENWTDEWGWWQWGCDNGCPEDTTCSIVYLGSEFYDWVQACRCMPDDVDYCAFISLWHTDTDEDAWGNCSAAWCPSGYECRVDKYCPSEMPGECFYSCNCNKEGGCGYQELDGPCIGECEIYDDCMEGYKIGRVNEVCECVKDSVNGQWDGDCYDSDYNADPSPYMYKGYCEDITGTYIDCCHESIMYEWYCDEGVCDVEELDCGAQFGGVGDVWGCINGRCTNEEPWIVGP